MKRFLSGLVVASLMVLALFVIPVHAANPALAQTGGGALTFNSGSTISVGLNSVTLGDAIVVVQYNSLGCFTMKTPSDTFTNNFQTFGCFSDGIGGSIQSYYVPSSAHATGADTVKCNWLFAVANDACYVFDITNPGTISAPASAVGLGSFITLPPFSAPSSSLILETAGLDAGCQAVTIPGPLQSPPTIYNPPSECGLNPFTFPNSYNGLSGAWKSFSSGAVGWAMAVTGSVYWTAEAIVISPAVVTTTTTATTGTIVGWLAPDSTHFSNALLILIFPLAGLSFGIITPVAFKIKGDTAVLFALGGGTVGSILADLPAGNSPALGIPFAFTFVWALITFLYWWNT